MVDLQESLVKRPPYIQWAYCRVYSCPPADEVVAFLRHGLHSVGEHAREGAVAKLGQ